MTMLRQVQIGEGGLLHGFLGATRLTRVPGQILAVIVAVWLPLVCLGLATEQFAGRTEPVIRDPSVHVRLLVAIPLFLILDLLFTHACRICLEQLVSQGFIPASEEQRFDRLIHRAIHAADAVLPEAVLALLVLVVSVAAAFGGLQIGGLALWSAASPTQIWYALVGWSLYQFLLWRSLWRWAIWMRLLAGLSRLDLAVVPIHSDRRGGLGFLGLPSSDYCAMLLFAVSSVLSAEWGNRLDLTSLQSFEPFVIAFVLVSVLIAFGPLLLFAPQLERARRLALVEIAALGTHVGRLYERQFRRDHSPEGELGPDTALLAYTLLIQRNAVERFVPVPIYLRDFVTLLAATLLPIVPVVLMRVPSSDWRALLQSVTGIH
jgi:hypothetical protein